MKSKTNFFNIVVCALITIYSASSFAIYDPQGKSQLTSIDQGQIEVFFAGKGYNTCRATRVAPDLLVTAAHCLFFVIEDQQKSQTQIVRPSHIDYLFHDEKLGIIVPMEAKTWIPHPAYKPDAHFDMTNWSVEGRQKLHQDDIAIIVLDDTFLKTGKLAKESAFFLPYQTIENAGLSLEMNGAFHTNIKGEVAHASEYSSIKTQLTIYKLHPDVRRLELRVTVRESQEPKICPGDSGSGLINPINKELVGVLSTHEVGFLNYMIDSSSRNPCYSGQIFATDVSAYNNWITKTYLSAQKI